MKTLLCTVGGSHQPVIKAIQDNQPDFVLFVCSDDDLTTGRPGSYEQIEKSGIFLKQGRDDEKPTLPNIPSQLKMQAEGYQILKVYADDLDHAYRGIALAIHEYVQRGDDIIVDYTGGTKTMSAALCLAALDHDDISLQLVTGVRSDLTKVKDGTEQSQSAEIGRTRFQLKLQQALGAWGQYAYDDAIFQLKSQKPSHREDKAALTTLRELSRAFSYWDRFDHTAALEILNNYERYKAELKPYLSSLRDLCRDGKRQTPSRLLDLWLNTQRCAFRQRYDDATARAYRLIEWSAQWLLESQAGILTADVPPQKVPDGMMLNEHKGKLLASLVQAWQLAAVHCNEEVGVFWEEQEERLKTLLQIRNNSILAHGFETITRENWQKIEYFLESALIPLVLSQVNNIGMRDLSPQLPVSFSIGPVK